MKKFIFTILWIVFCGFNIFAQSEITQEEYDFYAKFINGKYVVNRFTQILEPIYLKAAKKKMRKIPDELIEDFKSKNKQSYRIGEKLTGFRFSDEPKPNLDAERIIVFTFDAKIVVSRVGFTEDKKQALVFYSTSYEGLGSGFTALVGLVYKNGEWETKNCFQPWIH